MLKYSVIERPRVLISACLLGEKCRYDGGHKYDDVVASKIGQWVEWIKVCPESDAGLPTPREPMIFDGKRMVTASGADITEKIRGFAERIVSKYRKLGLRGFICKKGSPSCGLTTTLGLFTEEIVRAFPDMPVVEEWQMHDAYSRESFISRLSATTTSSPAVSVVMPVRDAVATIDEAIDSVMSQTLEDFELIVVDDGSSDGTIERLVRWADRDSRVRVFTRPRRGLVAALNDGLILARSRFVARMDADDISIRNRLENQLAYLAARPEVVVVGSLIEIFPRKTSGMLEYEAWVNSLVEPEDIAREIFVESPLPHPSVMFRRDVIKAIGGYREGPFPEDYDLWLRLNDEKRLLGKVREVLLRWRDSETRLSRQDPRYSFESFRRLKVEHLASFLCGRQEVQICGAGPYAKAWRKALEAAGIKVVRFLDVDPKKIGGWVSGKIPVLDWRHVNTLRDVPMLCAVCRRGARPQIRETLNCMGFREGFDYIFVQ